MQLRPYQIDVKRRCYDALKEHKKVLLQLPTGAGKTVLFSSITRDAVSRDRGVMILVHRQELIRQAYNKLEKFGLGMQCGIILSGVQEQPGLPVQIASVQTLVRRPMPKHIDVIIIDEAHHAVAASYRKIIDNYPDAWILGVTATPCRTNGAGFDDIFSKLVVGASVQKLIKEGYLVEPRLFVWPLHADLSQVKKTAGDYNEKELSRLLDNKALVGGLVEHWQLRAQGKRTVVFAIDIRHSKHITETYREQGIAAAHIDGSTPDHEREKILRDFAAGQFPVLSNVGIVTEGFDVPEIECVQLTRPSKSLSLYLQMVGRGLRPADGKEAAIVLDHAGLISEHLYPQMDRDWTLKGIKKKTQEEGGIQIKLRDVKTGQLFTERELPPHITDVELVEVRYDPSQVFLRRTKEIDRLMFVGRKNNWKPGVAWWVFLKNHERVSASEVRYFCGKVGYHPGWAKHEIERLSELNLLDGH